MYKGHTMKNLFKTILAAATIAATPLIAAPPPKYIDVDANYQQSQDLDDLNIQQGASMRLRLRHKVDGSWPTLTGNTARWEARQQLTNTSAYTATSNLTSNEAHFIQFDLNNVQTGTSLTNWFYSIILVDGGEDYPIGVGTLNVIASDFAGSSGVLVGSGYETNSVTVTDSVSIINFASGISATHDGTNKLTLTVASSAGGDLTEVQVSGSILTVASGTGPIPVVGLTTAAVNSAESDPIAILPDGTRSMTADLQMGTNKVQDVTGIHFVPTNSAVSSVEGNVYWDETDITLALRSDIADAIMQVGQEFWMRAKKDAGETISNGDAVYISGASGERPKVARADSVTNSHVVGLATHTWTSNDGWVTMEGLVRDLDTSSYSEGDELFVSATLGGLTNVSQFVGQGSVATVTRSHASAGHVFVAIVHSELEPAWNAVSNTVTANALLGSTALQSYTETDPVWGAASNGVAYLDSTQTFTGFNTFDDGSYQVDLLPGSKAAYFDDVSLTHWVHIVNGTYGIKAEVGDASSLIAGQYTDGVGGNTVNLGDNMNGFAVNVTAGASYFDGMVDLNTDALAGTDAVSWSVLTNQIALLSPAGGTYTGGTNIDVNGTIINLDAAAVASDALADSATQPADSVTTLDATAWRTLYSDASGNITELALGTSGQHLKSNGASSAPTWETPSAGGGSQTPWTNNVDAAGFALTALDYTSMNTNAAAVTGVAAKLVQYILNDRLYSVYDSVTNYAVLN